MQQTNYYISLSEKQEVLREYNEIVKSDRFIGPTSRTIQLSNLTTLSAQGYGVSEKADGERHLLYISGKGKIYLIKQTLQVVFTGCLTKQEIFFHSLLDGELILHNSDGSFINMYMAFDIYFIGTDAKKKKSSVSDCRHLPFFLCSDVFKETDKKHTPSEYRYKLLESVLKRLQPIPSVVEDKQLPMLFAIKTFFFPTPKRSIFECNSAILATKFPYAIDGLVFTSMDKKADENATLKWKPAAKNTVDFLVKFIKETIGFSHDIDEKTGSIQEIQQVILKCGYTKAQIHLDPKRFILEGEEFAYEGFDTDKTYIYRQFLPTNPYTPNAGVCRIAKTKKECFTESNELIFDGAIVEFRYDLDKSNWIPVRLRHDKGHQANNFLTANNNWTFLHYPVTQEMMTTDSTILKNPMKTMKTMKGVDLHDVYYNPAERHYKATERLREFHNMIKRKLLEHVVTSKTFSTTKTTLIDLGCGKGGDLHKWIHNKVDFVFGVDFSNDNIVNTKDGCYARYFSQCYWYNKATKKMERKPDMGTYCLFVHGDCGKNILTGEGIPSTEDYELVKCLLLGEKSKQETLNHLFHGLRDVTPAHGLFDICSCQFALHYFFKSKETIKSFLVNVYNTTKVNGYFIGCCFDGRKVFDALNRKENEVFRELDTNQFSQAIQIEINDDDGNRIFLLHKDFKRKTLDNDASCIGLKINVYQESINSLVAEYLVNFDYLESLMELIGFYPVVLPLFDTKVYFDDIYTSLQSGFQMSEIEKTISFLNRTFVFQKKTAIMNPEKIEIF
jgi:hypothetical protein